MRIAELERRLNNLEQAFLQSQRNNINVTAKADSVVIVDGQVDGLDAEVKANTESIEDCNVGLMETYEIAENNTSEIEDCNNALMELYEMMEG